MITPLAKYQLRHLFANNSSTDSEVYCPTFFYENTEAQNSHPLFSKYIKDKLVENKDGKISPTVIDDSRVLMYETKCLVIPTAEIQSEVIQWYHRYLQHPGKSRLEETIA
jgi:hypothetical protein